MKLEEKLKDLILTRYKSLREFSIMYDIPYTTLKSMLERGIGNSSVTNVIKLCKALNISADALADGEITPTKKQPDYKFNDRIEIKEVLEEGKYLLSHHGFITLDGKQLNRGEVESMLDAMEVVVELAKKKKLK